MEADAAEPNSTTRELYVYDDYNQLMFRWDGVANVVYVRPYGDTESVNPLPCYDKMFNEARLYGTAISREEYERGKPRRVELPLPHSRSYAPGTQFAVYAGLPLTRLGDECTAYDRFYGRSFDRELFEAQAKPCKEAQFRHAAEIWPSQPYQMDVAAGIPVVLPRIFPAGTKFAVIDGVPVSAIDSKDSTAWDRAGGRDFLHADFDKLARIDGEAEFRQAVEKVNAAIADRRRNAERQPE